MTLQRTETAPAEQRGGTYEHDGLATSLLRYRTHTIHDLPRTSKVCTMGSAPDRDIVVEGECVSASHCRIERRARGLVVTDAGSKNGTYYEAKRALGHALIPSFEEKRALAKGFVLDAGMTFVLGKPSHRYLALDDAMRAEHPALLDIVGGEVEVGEENATRGSSERASPSDLILAADGAGHILITGDPGCDQEELARIVHAISKRRRHPPVQLARVPEGRDAQGEILKHDAAKGTLVLDLGDRDSYVDPTFVSSLFSSSYQIRVIVLARTVEGASRALGAQYVHPMMQVGLRPLSARRSVIQPLLDRWLAQQGSPLRLSDLTPENERALLVNDWRENLAALREAALRLAAIVRAGFSLNRARQDIGVNRNTFYNWYGSTMRLSLPLVPESREKALAAAIATQTQVAKT